MPSSPSNSLRLEEQFTGENVNTWGILLNRVISMLDAGIAGLATIALTGNYSLSSHNYIADEARNAVVQLMGSAPWAVTIPSVSKVYVFWNASSAIQTVTTGAGTSVALQVGEIVLLICDAVNVKRVVATVMGAGPFSMSGPLDMGGNKITGGATPTNPTDFSTKGYADALAFTANAGILPGQGGNAGKFLTTDATTASWSNVPTTSITGFSAVASAVRTGTTTTAALTPGDTYNAFAVVPITYAASVAPDMGSFINGAITLTGNLTLANPTSHKVGQSGFIQLTQDATGSRILAVGSFWKRVGGLGVLSTTAGASDILEYQVISSTLILYDILRNPA